MNTSGSLSAASWKEVSAAASLTAAMNTARSGAEAGTDVVDEGAVVSSDAAGSPGPAQAATTSADANSHMSLGFMV